MIAAAITASAVLGWGTATHLHRSPDDAQLGSVVAHADDKYPSETPTDWARNADHIVVVRAVSETETRLTADEVEAGEGVTGRQVVFKVESTEWSRDGAPALPASLSWQEGGFQYRGGERTAEFGLSEAPRVEVGHRFLIGVKLVPTEGGAPGGWAPLSSAGTVLPYDGETIGEGEGDPGQDEGYEPASPTEEDVWGGDADDLVEEIEAAGG